MPKRKVEVSFAGDSCSGEEETPCERCDSSDNEEVRLCEKSHVNTSTWSDCDSDYDKRGSINQILQDLLVEETVADDAVESAVQFGEWSEFRDRQRAFSFIGTSGLAKQLPSSISPYGTLALFIDNEIIDTLVSETNRYAEEKLSKSALSLHKWTRTNAEEIKRFLGLMLWMGYVKVNPVSNYWSRSSLYNFHLPRAVMSRDRFELLLRNFHFVDNASIGRDDRLGKILPLLHRMQGKYQEVFTPGEDVVIDESLIPWHERLVFERYIPNAAHKYGVKLFKLCSSEGYTWSMKIYSGRSVDGVRETGSARNVCLQLADQLLRQGRTLYIDNFYASYELAVACVNRTTHIIGTLKANKRFLPKDLLERELKRGEMASREDENGIVVLKWRDTRDVAILSSKHAPVMKPSPRNIRDTFAASQSRSLEKSKPLAVVAYDRAKRGIDYSDQLLSYATTLRKGMKWYRKLGIQLLLGISIVNAWIVYKIATRRKIDIKRFRELIAMELLGMPEDTAGFHFRHDQHNIAVRKNASGTSVRRACKLCYSNKRRYADRSYTRENVKKTTTFCPDCPDQPQLCIDCFKTLHSK